MGRGKKERKESRRASCQSRTHVSIRLIVSGFLLLFPPGLLLMLATTAIQANRIIAD
jgi:hypothetical protein